MESSGGREGCTVYRSSFESANHSEGEHQLVCVSSPPTPCVCVCVVVKE